MFVETKSGSEFETRTCRTWRCAEQRRRSSMIYLFHLQNLHIMSDVWTKSRKLCKINGESTQFKIMLGLFHKDKHDWQCTDNVTLRRVHPTTAAVEKQWVLHNLSVCICNHRYPGCNTHAPYCHLWSGPLYNFFFFSHYLISGTVFGKRLLNTKSVFWFSLQLLSETFLILWRNERDMIKKYILVFM
jgi:hypothetical protein